MASTVARSILRRTSFFHLSSTVNASHHLALCFSSLASFSQSSSLVRKAQTQNLCYSPLLISPKFASFKVGDDDNLIKVLQSEIDCVQEPKDPRDITVPKNFPFEIIESHGGQTITLKRKYGNENIQVTVYMNLDIEGDSRQGNVGDQEGTTIQPNIFLHITVDKGQGFILEFSGKLTPSELEMESMASRSFNHFDGKRAYQGPAFSDLDENLQKALHKYLEVRGIKSSLHSFLYEYMINKDERGYLKWLKNLKEFVLK